MSILEKNEITPDTLGLLWFLKANETGEPYVRKMVKEYLYDFKIKDTEYCFAEVFEKKDWLKYIKGKPKDELWDKARCTKKGTEIVYGIFKKPLHELTNYLLDYIIEKYKELDLDPKYLMRNEKVENYASEFLYYKEKYTESMIRTVIDYYVLTYEDKPKYFSALPNLFYKVPYGEKSSWKPEICPLALFINNHSEQIIEYHKNKLRKT